MKLSPEDLVERDAVIAEIAAAFERVSLDDGVTMHEARAIEDYAAEEDRLAAREKDHGVRWQDIPDETLRQMNDVHNFLDPKGFHFYIAAFLTWALKHCDDERDDHSGHSEMTMFALDPSGLHPERLGRFRHFDVAQRRAICRFLRFVSRSADGSPTDEDKYLGDYWGQFCASPPDVSLNHH